VSFRGKIFLIHHGFSQNDTDIRNFPIVYFRDLLSLCDIPSFIFLYKVPHHSDSFKEGMSLGDTVRDMFLRGKFLLLLFSSEYPCLSVVSSYFFCRYLSFSL
jgi:hypothetical protein